MIVNTFGSRLRDLRNVFKLTQQELADRLGISKSSINMYERGEREPGLEMISRIADFFFVDTNYLLGKPQDQETPQNLVLGEELERNIRQISAEIGEDYDKLKEIILTKKVPLTLNYNGMMYIFAVYLGKPLAIRDSTSNNELLTLIKQLTPEQQDLVAAQIKGILAQKNDPSPKGDG